MNREGNDNTLPSLKSLRDSGEIEQEADVIFSWTAEKKQLDRFFHLGLYLAKNRHGAQKELIVNWDKLLKTFEVVP
jgi:replicative DNA helicase